MSCLKQIVAFGFLFLFSLPCLANYDLSLRASSTNNRPLVNEIIEINLDFENLGPQSATDVSVVVQFPEGAMIPANQAPMPNTGTLNSNNYEWYFSEYPVGSKETLILPIEFVEKPESGCAYVFAGVDFYVENNDVNEQNNQFYLPFYFDDVTSCADAGLVSDSINKFLNNYAFTVFVVNNGIQIERNLTVKVEQRFLNISAFEFTQNFCSKNECKIDSLEPGGKIELTYRAEDVNVQRGGLLEVEFSLSGSSSDINLDNNVLIQEVVIEAPASTPGLDIGIDPIDIFGSAVGSSAGCFIATAAYGSEIEHEVMLLRAFRDNVLMQYSWGRSFIDLYYRYSPPLADYIADRDALRFLVRGALWPVVFVIKYPALLFCLAFSVCILILRLRRGRVLKGA